MSERHLIPLLSPVPARSGPPLRWAFVATAVVLAACGKPAAQAPAGGPGGAAPEVGVVTVAPGDVGLVGEWPGRLEASRVAQVRARATGILQSRLFQEGADVKAGQPLFVIDPAPYDAALASAQAQLVKAEANLAQATAQLDRLKPLLPEKAVSQQEYTAAESAQKQAAADVGLARAGLQTARINRAYADVSAPIAGRIGRALVTEGALVSQTEGTALAVVQQIDPLYVNFTQPAQDALRWTAAGGKKGVPVKVVLADGSEHQPTGRLLFADLTVDSGTGQVTLRAEVPNPGGRLLPGLYVRVRLEQAKASQAVSLPQQAVTRTPQGDTVLVVGEGGKVQTRPVQVGAQQGAAWVVTGGLNAGDQVVVDGVQRLQMLPPGTPVKPVPWTAPTAAAGSASKPAAQ